MMSFFVRKKAGGFLPPSIDYIIVGLGNPGVQYERTRHNCGWRAVDYIASQLPDAPSFKKKFSALAAECRFADARVLLLKPLTFMNASGEAVSAARRFYKLPAERVLVISDDAALPLGRIRIRKSGSDGGQKGLRNIILHLSTENIPRIKIGVADGDMSGYDLASFVLGSFDDREEKLFFEVLPSVFGAARDIVNGKAFEAVMSEYNGTNSAC